MSRLSPGPSQRQREASQRASLRAHSPADDAETRDGCRPQGHIKNPAPTAVREEGDPRVVPASWLRGSRGTAAKETLTPHRWSQCSAPLPLHQDPRLVGRHQAGSLQTQSALGALSPQPQGSSVPGNTGFPSATSLTCLCAPTSPQGGPKTRLRSSRLCSTRNSDGSRREGLVAVQHGRHSFSVRLCHHRGPASARHGARPRPWLC